MGAVAFLARRRLARQWRGLVAGGMLLGLGFGICFASISAARRTASAYDRVLTGAEAADAAVALGGSPEDSERSLRDIEGITDQRVYAGFLGAADNVDRLATTALIAPIRDRFPIDRPQLTSGRLPRAGAPGEAIVSRGAAERGDLEIGQRLHFRFVNPLNPMTTETEITIVGIGTFPVEAVADETSILGVFVFTRAFYDAHRDFVVYSVSNVDLAPGFDARGDLAAEVAALGHELQSARTQEQQAVNEALRPLIIVLIALGVLAFGATAIGAGQMMQRNRDRWLSDDVRLRALGIARHQVRAVELASSAAVAAAAVVTALVATVLMSPLAPVGPLHDLDPDQGVNVDTAVAIVGSLAIIATIALLTLAFSSVRKRQLRPVLVRSPWLAALPGSPATVAGLTLALRTDDGRGRGWRAVAATSAAAAGLAMCSVFVASATTLTESPGSYGFDADLLALNAYGDQSESSLQRAFGDRDDVLAATGYTEGSYLVDGRAVPGLAETRVKRELTPTILRGRAPLSDHEIAVGADTLDAIEAELGDTVPVQLQLVSDENGDPAGDRVPMTIVGVATFPAVAQIGTDMARLGTGVLVTRDGFLRLGGDAANDPEFTVVRLAEGTKPAAVIAANPEGFRDAAQSTTAWFTDVAPAELRQLEEARPYLRGALVVGYAILMAVIVHALWTRARANRHDLAVLRVIGCIQRQLDTVTAWQVTPFAVCAVLLGVPIGIALGRFAFTVFAQSLAVVESVSISVALVAGLVVAVLIAAAVADLVAVAISRRSRTVAVLRET